MWSENLSRFYFLVGSKRNKCHYEMLSLQEVSNNPYRGTPYFEFDTELQHLLSVHSQQYLHQMCIVKCLFECQCKPHHLARWALCLDHRMRLREPRHLHWIIMLAYGSCWRALEQQLIKSLTDLLNLEKPSCLQITDASLALQKSSQTVPHVSLTHTSTRPTFVLDPPTNLTSPWLHRTVECM